MTDAIRKLTEWTKELPASRRWSIESHKEWMHYNFDGLRVILSEDRIRISAQVSSDAILLIDKDLLVSVVDGLIQKIEEKKAGGC